MSDTTNTTDGSKFDPEIAPADDFADGDAVRIRYESARTGTPQTATGIVRELVAPHGGNDRHYSLRVYDESNHRTILVTTHTGEVETRERRGHMLTLGPLLAVTPD